MLDLIKKARFLDPKLFPAFAAAAEVRNFTHAAKVAHMTQSGISQHIAKLESQLERQLFKRIGKQVVLTDTGTALLKYLRDHVAELDMFFDRIHAQGDSLSGVVSYAMPPSCLFSNHFAQLLSKRASEKNLRLKVTLASSPEVLDLVLDGRVDFGFVTFKPSQPAVRFEPYCDEEYILVSSDAELMKTMPPQAIFAQSVIGYPGADVYYNMWLKHHLRDSRDYHSLVRTGEINVIDGAITMVAGGLGCGVFPRHCVQPRLDSGELFEYRSSNPAPLRNKIYVAKLAREEPSRRVHRVIEWFFEMVAEEGGKASDVRSRPARAPAAKGTAVTRARALPQGRRARAEPVTRASVRGSSS